MRTLLILIILVGCGRGGGMPDPCNPAVSTGDHTNGNPRCEKQR